MKSNDNTLLTIAIIAVIVAAIGLILTWNNVYTFQRILLSPVETGEVEVTITENINIQIVNTPVDFDEGYTLTDQTTCTVNTEDGPDPITCFGFQNTLPFIVRNIGTVDVDLYLKVAALGEDWIGGGTSDLQFKASQGEPLSCGTIWFSTYTSGIVGLGFGDLYCEDLSWGEETDVDAHDELQIDVQVLIDEFAVPSITPKSTTVTATATAT
ncbi:MAG: hypothetical protein KJ718_06080 [Nanoarchaeota archaeon]|nr:hypothetical protein [Nanoarchaeota archaeon]MBU1052090.1 hypothetical protein [Nanoarchaeota archaeon]MBU1988478.1 hypothetical protein [Nanoarchaeota archaeon]